MKSAATEHALTVVIENNVEEVNRFVMDPTNPRLKPTEILQKPTKSTEQVTMSWLVLRDIHNRHREKKIRGGH